MDTPHSQPHILGGGSPKTHGCIRRAPSNLTTSPLTMGFSAKAWTRCAYSDGWPKREGKGTCWPRKFRTLSGKPANNGVEKSPEE